MPFDIEAYNIKTHEGGYAYGQDWAKKMISRVFHTLYQMDRPLFSGFIAVKAMKIREVDDK